MLKPYSIRYCMLLIACLSLLGCHKNVTDAGPSQEFFISFSTTDSNFLYQTGPDYDFFRDGGFAYNASGSGYDLSISPATVLGPLPFDANLHTVGFVFGYDKNIFCCAIPWTPIGDTLFKVGQRTVCYTGINYLSNLGELSCYIPNDVTIFWAPPGRSVLNSGSGLQPPGSYFQIDTVIDFHHSENNTLRIYDKIISGSFQCRVFDPLANSNQKDMVHGKFRMPVWRNAHD